METTTDAEQSMSSRPLSTPAVLQTLCEQLEDLTADPETVITILQRLLDHLLGLNETNNYDPLTLVRALQIVATRFPHKTEDTAREEPLDVSNADYRLSLHYQIRFLCLQVLAHVAQHRVGLSWWAQIHERRAWVSHVSPPSQHHPSTSSSSTSPAPLPDDPDSVVLTPDFTLTTPASSSVVPPEGRQQEDPVDGRSLSPMTQTSSLATPSPPPPPSAHQKSSTSKSKEHDNESGGGHMSHSYIPIPEELVVAMIDLAASLVESSTPAWDCAKAQMTIVVTLCCDPNKESLSSDWVIPGIQQPLGDMVYSWLQFLRMDDKDRPVGVTKALEDLALAGWMPRKDIFAHLLQPILYFLETETSSLSDLNTFLPLSNMLSAMASLLSRVTMPNEYVIPMLRILSRLMIDLAQEDAATCRNEAQRVVGSLLSNEVSAMTTVDYLLSLYDAVNFGSQGCKLPSGDELFSWDDDTTRVCKLGGSSIRVLCEALWGDGAEQSSIALLRIFWRPLLDLLFTGLASLLRVLEDLTPDTEPMNYLSGLMVDILCAFSNSLRNEADPKTGNMSTIEWQCVTEEFVKNIKPCLLIQNSDMVTVEAKSKVQIMCSCLEHYAANENAPFTEYEFQRRLYIGLLRQVAPILTDTSLCVRLNSAIFACWAKFGMFPYRLEGWSETASDLLEESFRKRSNGVFYQTPEVRLFILKTLTRNNSVVNEMKNEESMNLPPSLLELTRHAEEEHLEFVQSAIFTILNEILGEFSAPGSQVKYDEDSPSALPVPSSRGSFTKIYPCCTTSDLLLYAVKLAGVLFYSYLENVRQCQQCVELLGAVSRDFFQHSPSSCSSSDLIHSYNIRLAALFELQKCLENVFVSTSPCHACIPTMVESFCAVLTDFSLAREAQPSSANVYHALLAVAALEPMARLQVTFDGCVAFQRNGAPPYCFDPELLLTASRIDCGSAYADAVKHRNVRIVQLGEGRRIPSPDLTVLDFGSVLSAVSVFLRSPKLPPRDGQVELNETLAYMRVSCFQILRHLAVSMVPTAELLGSMNIIFDLPKLSGFTTDMMTKIRDMTVAQLLESELVLHHLDGAEEEYEVSMNIKEFLGILFPDRDDYIREEVLSREMVTSLCLCLTSLGSPPLDNVRGLAFAVLAKIVCATEPQNDIFDIRLPVSGPILTIVHDLLLNSPAIRIPNELKQTLVRKLLFQVHRGISNQASLTENHSYRTYLAIRCLTAILDRLDTKGLQLLAAEFRKSVEMPPNSGEAILELLRNLTNEKSRILPNKYRDDERVFRRYELLSREASLISNFTAGSSAAWLSGEATLVTCRLGASSTRYQGFIEVVVRTLTGKHRELIKIQGGAILDNPETISGSSTMSPQNARTRSGLEPPGNPWAFADKTAQRAAAVLARFEAATTHSSDSSCRREVVHVAKPKAEEKFDVTGSEAPEIALWLFHALNGAPSDISGVLSDIVVFLALVGIDVDACKSLQRLQDGANLDRAIGVLDRIPHGNTHKVALLYDAIDNSPKPSVDSDNHLLSTTKCSPAFHRFANYLGEIVPIQSLGYFSGGLDTSSDESDGAFSLLWNDSDDSCDVAATSIVFHAISLLPNVGPLSFVNRKRHVGNDFVIIVFAERFNRVVPDYDRSKGNAAVSGDFGLVLIFVSPIRTAAYRVSVRIRREGVSQAVETVLADFVGDNTVAEACVASFVRGIAVRADIACRVATGTGQPPSNCMSRFQSLQSMKKLYMKK